MKKCKKAAGGVSETLFLMFFYELIKPMNWIDALNSSESLVETDALNSSESLELLRAQLIEDSRTIVSETTQVSVKFDTCVDRVAPVVRSQSLNASGFGDLGVRRLNDWCGLPAAIKSDSGLRGLVSQSLSGR